MVKRLNPHALVEEPPLLGSDALVHILHRKADAMGEVSEGFLNIDYSPLVSVIRLKRIFRGKVRSSHPP